MTTAARPHRLRRLLAAPGLPAGSRIVKVMATRAIPITTGSADGIPPDTTDRASGLIDVAGNAGGSIAVSLAQNVLAHRSQFHLGRFAEHAIPSSVPCQEGLRNVAGYFAAHGSSTAEARNRAVAWIGTRVPKQASFLAYVDVFWVLMLISPATVPLSMIARR